MRDCANMDGENKKSAADSRTSPTPTENHNHNRLRKRNVADSGNVASSGDSAKSDRVPLVILPDSTKAWHDGDAPRIPDVIATNVAISGKLQNGVLIHEDDNDDSDTTDLLIDREKMKINVIRGSVANPDLTLGELRLLGCSSEGFVNGTLPG